MSKITEITKRILMNKESKIQVKDSVKTKKKETKYYCPECGKPIKENEVICQHCKSQLFDSSMFM